MSSSSLAFKKATIISLLFCVAALVACGGASPPSPEPALQSAPLPAAGAEASPTAASNPTSTSSSSTSAPDIGYRVGDLAPDFTVVAMDGRNVTRDELLAEGKPYVLYFFATW